MIKKYFFTALLTLSICTITFAQVGVGTTTPQGALDISSSTTGLIPPRVSLTSTIIEAPVINPQGGSIIAGTTVWNTATAGTSPNNVAPGLYFWNGTRWVAFAGSPGGLDWSLTGNSGTTAGTNFLGTTDANGLRIKTNNIDRWQISNANNGQLQSFALGTAALPVYSFQGDQDTGLFSSGADVLNLSTNGLERARILSGGTLGINSAGTTFSQLTITGAGTNDGIASSANDGIANAFWGRNAHATGCAVIGATNGLGGVFPTLGAGVAGSGTNSYGVSGITGNGAPNNSAHNGHAGGYFTLDSDNNPATMNSSAFAQIAGKDEQIITPLGGSSRRILYGGYFVSGIAAQTYSYVALKYNHNNDATATGGTDYKIVGNGVVSTLIPDEDFYPRVMFCPEAPEVLFEDYGIGKLQNGEAFIELDKIVSKSLKIDESHPLKVFIQLEGECNGVFVTEKTKDGFKVKELNGGNNNISFSWHIVGNRADSVDQNGNITSHYQDLRLPYGPKPLQEPKTTSKK
ncbi:hypothetical protein [Flavobacterium sp.]|jgi:hypothetical protein|uniref:hypothetical protein n=1 Tax=Flavobacterium sp. TaxID=239 RepID=UPI002A806066|nr:hypothetical protein [Flavobacterium sp.]